MLHIPWAGTPWEAAHRDTDLDSKVEVDNNSLQKAVAVPQGKDTDEAAVDSGNVLAREEPPAPKGMAVDDVCPVVVARVEVVAACSEKKVANIGHLAGAGDGVKVVCWCMGMAEMEQDWDSVTGKGTLMC